MKTALRMPEIVKFSNKTRMTSEEVMLRGLYELVSGNDQHEATVHFGRDQSAQSRAFSWFIDHAFTTFNDLVTNNLEWWYRNGYLARSMEAIKQKIGEMIILTCLVLSIVIGDFCA